MSEQTTGKKMVSRNIAIVIGIICIVLVVCLAGTVVYYQSMDLQISSLTSKTSSKDFIIATLNS